MTLPLTSKIDKSRIVDLVKSICVFALLPRLDTFQQNNLRNAVDVIERLTKQRSLNLLCHFEQEPGGARTKIVMEITFGEPRATN